MRGGGCNPTPEAATPCQRLQPYMSQVLTVHDDPAAFAEAAARLLLDGAEWSARSDAALRHTRTVLRARLSVAPPPKRPPPKRPPPKKPPKRPPKRPRRPQQLNPNMSSIMRPRCRGLFAGLSAATPPRALTLGSRGQPRAPLTPPRGSSPGLGAAGSPGLGAHRPGQPRLPDGFLRRPRVVASMVTARVTCAHVRLQNMV